MPPKKRKTTESASTPQSTKRVTRSSTKGDTSNAQAAVKPSQTTSKSPIKVANPPKATSKSRATQATSAISTTSKAEKSKAPTKSLNPQPNASTLSFSTLSILSHRTKSPTQCNFYSASTPSPTLIFTHGAGGALSAPAVTNFCTGFSATSPVLAFQGSMNLGSRVKGFHACIEHLGEESKKKRLVLGGRSMGARAAVIAGAEVLKEEGDVELELVLASYPLQGPKDVRDQILLDLPASVRVLCVVGDRDGMCPLRMLDEVRKKMEAKSQLVIVRGADHGMHVKPARLEQEIGEETGRIAADWVAGNVKEDVIHIGEEA